MAPKKSGRESNRKRAKSLPARGRTAPLPRPEAPNGVRVGEDGFPLVAIGASAGGLEAVTEMLHGMPTEIGAALVLVQHLDPGHSSILAEILARTTSMPVHTIDSGMEVRANTVFVIPPNHGLELTDGRFRLTPRRPPIGRPMPVDQFFRSVAEAYRTRAIGV